MRKAGKITSAVMAIACATIFVAGCDSLRPERVYSEDFQWSDSSTIIGLSDSGINRKTLVIPANCKELSNFNLKNNYSCATKVQFESNDDISLEGVFSGDDIIVDIDLPDNLTTLGVCCFQECSSLESISIPAGVTVIPTACFALDTSLNNIVFEGDISEIHHRAFWRCSSLQTIALKDSIERIDNFAFAECTSLSSIVLPSSLTTIGDNVFDGSGVTLIVVPADMVLSEWSQTSFDTKGEYTVQVTEGSWADEHFEEVFTGSVTKQFS